MNIQIIGAIIMFVGIYLETTNSIYAKFIGPIFIILGIVIMMKKSRRK